MSGQPDPTSSGFVIVDDSRLVELAREPATSLFPTLERARAIRPLVLLMAAIPFVLVMETFALSENDASWGLKALAVLSATDWTEFVSPRLEGNEVPWAWAPPLGSWLACLSMFLFGPENMAGLFATSGVATLLLVLALFRLVCSLADERQGILVVLLLATSIPIIRMAQSASPESVAFLFCVVSIWSFVSHLNHTTNLISFRLLASGIFLGLSVLAAGSITILITALLALFILCTRSAHIVRAPLVSVLPRKNGIRTMSRALAALAVVVFTACAVGGWWVGMMGNQFGAPFWSVWWNGIYVETPSVESYSEQPALLATIATAATLVAKQLGFLLGLAISGIVRSVIELGQRLLRRESRAAGEAVNGGASINENVTNDRRSNDSELRVLAGLWIIVGGIYLLILVRVAQPDSNAIATAIRFVALPSILFAAVSCRRIVDRDVTFYEVAAILITGMIPAVYQYLPDGEIQVRVTQIPWLAGLLTVVTLSAVLGFAIYSRRNAPRERLFIQTCLLTIIACNLLHGLWQQPRDSDATQVLHELRAKLVETDRVRFCFLLADGPPPMKLEFAVRDIQRSATFRIIRIDAPSASARTSTDSLRGLVEKQRAGDSGHEQKNDTIIVLWSSAAAVRKPLGSIPGLQQLAVPRLFEDRYLATYRLINAHR